MPPADANSPGKDPSRPSGREPLMPRPTPSSAAPPRPPAAPREQSEPRGQREPLTPRATNGPDDALDAPAATPSHPERERSPEEVARAEARARKREARREAWQARLRPVRRSARRAWTRTRSEARRTWTRMSDYRTLRDVVGALVLVGTVLGALSLATGGAWPPLLVVESGSMMHANFDTSYGRIGTIDVGDIVFLRDVDEPLEDVDLWVDGGEDHYGRPGDVIAFAPNGNRNNTTTVHRAITYVSVERLPEGGLEYTFRWIDGETKRFGREGIYFPALGFDENFGFTPRNGYKPSYSGYLTKGDNFFSNPAVDQALRITAVVEPSWIEGTVHGEVPWVGLGRLALQNGQTNPAVPGWERVGNAFAPVELWSMFFLVLGLVILVPLSVDTHRLWRRERERRRLRQQQLELDQGGDRRLDRRVATEFTPVLRSPSGATGASGAGAGVGAGPGGRGAGAGTGGSGVGARGGGSLPPERR